MKNFATSSRKVQSINPIKLIVLSIFHIIVESMESENGSKDDIITVIDAQGKIVRQTIFALLIENNKVYFQHKYIVRSYEQPLLSRLIFGKI